MRKNITVTVFIYMMIVIFIAFFLMGLFWYENSKDIIEESRNLEVTFDKESRMADLKGRVEVMHQYVRVQESYLKAETELMLKEDVGAINKQLTHLYQTYSGVLPVGLVDDIAIQSISATSKNEGQVVFVFSKGRFLLNAFDVGGLDLEIHEGFYFTNIREGQEVFRSLIYVEYVPAFDFYLGSYVNYDHLAHELELEILDYLNNVSDGFNGQISFFIHDYAGRVLTDGHYKSRIGENDYDFTNRAGIQPIQEQIMMVTGLEQAAFHEFDLYDDTPWLTYVVNLSDYGWVVGGRMNLEDWQQSLSDQADFQEKWLKEEVEEIVLILALILIVAIVAAYMLTKQLKVNLRSSLEAVKSSVEGQEPVALEKVNYKDLQEIAQATNTITQEIHVLKQRDPLTGLYNKNHMFELLDYEHLRCIQDQTPLSLALFDIAEFRTINDRYGFDAGDTVIKTVAALIVNQIRDKDKVVRYNGEEFLIIFSETPLDEAVEISKGIIETISSKLIDPILENINISAGLVDGQQDLVRKMIKNVEDALMKAKQLGSNQVYWENDKK